jgi:hypothetical protein
MLEIRFRFSICTARAIHAGAKAKDLYSDERRRGARRGRFRVKFSPAEAEPDWISVQPRNIARHRSWPLSIQAVQISVDDEDRKEFTSCEVQRAQCSRLIDAKKTESHPAATCRNQRHSGQAAESYTKR